jgi:type IV pilus assembly protein PilB
MKNAEKTTSDDKVDADILLVNKILLDAFENRATDIHFEWVTGKLRIRQRVDGYLCESKVAIPAEMQNHIINRIKIMANMDLKEKRLPQDGRILIKAKGQEYDLRVSVVPYATGESAVLRVLSQEVSAVFKLDRLGFTPANLARVKQWIKRPNGLIIVSGPTGCGKTTLLYAILQELNLPEVKITTIEEPVEYVIEGVNQFPVRQEIGLTFARAIRVQLRQATNIMMIGETRDRDSAEMEIRAALTGHLVLTSLHTKDAPAILRRMLDIGIEPFLLNSVFIGGVAQRLARKICEHCREEYKPEGWVMDLLGPHQPNQFFRGKGCDQCHKTGYHGRIAIHEILELNDALQKLVAKDASAAELHSQALKSGMISMQADGLAKAAQGITTVEEVLRACAG